MRKHSATPRQRSAQFEDIVLAVLGLIAGPLLWWMGQAWQQNPAATSVQTLEYWIALLCGFLGIGFCTVWGTFIVAGLGLVFATKTKNRVVGYWSQLCTPKFLQRIIISVLGIQLTLGSQAYATEKPHSEPTEVMSSSGTNPFMPELVEIPVTPTQDARSSPTAEASHDSKATSESPTRHEPSESPAGTRPSVVSPQPRQLSEIESEVVPDTAVDQDDEESPTPRQTTTTPVTPKPKHETVEQDPMIPDPTQAYKPQNPVPSPHIRAPNPDRSPEVPTVVIQTGDSLWDIAHQELGAGSTPPQIDQRWRQWWQHNSDVIGEDPHMLSPGTILKAPPFTH